MQEQLNHLINSVVDGLGYELWGYEYRAQTESALLRIFIDSKDGINVDDCAQVSRQLGAALDVDDLIPVAYILEVSSPGIDRVLFTPEQFLNYVGETLKVRTQIPVMGRRNFKGKMISADDEQIIVEVDNIEYEIPLDVVDRARLIIDAVPGKKQKR